MGMRHFSSILSVFIFLPHSMATKLICLAQKVEEEAQRMDDLHTYALLSAILRGKLTDVEYMIHEFPELLDTTFPADVLAFPETYGHTHIENEIGIAEVARVCSKTVPQCSYRTDILDLLVRQEDCHDVSWNKWMLEPVTGFFEFCCA